MKKITLFLFLLLSVSVSAQRFEWSDFILETFDDCSYAKVYENSLPKNQKYSNAKEWIAKTFGDYKTVLQYEDPENCKVIIKGRCPIKSYSYFNENKVRFEETPDLLFTLTIDCKDDKYRLKFENMTVDIVRETGLLSGKISNESCKLNEFMARGTRQRFSMSPSFANLLNSASQAIEKEDDF